MKKIERLEKGAGKKTLLHTDKGNELIDAVNSFRGMTVCPTGAGEFKFSDENVVLVIKDRKEGNEEPEEAVHPWKPYVVPYAGEGAPPDSQSRTIKIRPGSVTLGATMIPSNKNVEIEIPEDNDEGYFVWLKIDILSGPGGHFVSGVIYEHGVELPDAVDADPEEGTPPPTIYVPLFYITTIGDEIDEVVQLRDKSLSLSITLVDVGCDSKLLSFSIS